MSDLRRIQLNVKVPEMTAEEIKRLAISNHITVAEQLRRFIEQGLSVHSYEQNIDLIATIIRQELMSIYHFEDIRIAMDNAIDRNAQQLNRTLLKSGKASASGYFLLIKLMMYITNQISLEDFVRMVEDAGNLGVEYMNQKNSSINDLLTDGAATCHIANQ